MTFPSLLNSRGDVSPTELPALTSLRGIAALVVVLFHSSFIAFHYAGGAAPSIWRRGYLAVDLFFFLSGFVLAHAYGRGLAEELSWRTFRKFLWARFCRIYPAALFTTIIFVLQYVTGRLAFPGGVSFKTQLTAALLLMQVPWLDRIVINSPSWSISAEWYAYLIFPFIVPIICRSRGRMAAGVVIALVADIAVDHMTFSHEQQNWGWGALVRVLPEFTLGAFAYRFYSEGTYRAFFEKDGTFIGVLAMIIAGCLAGVSDGVIVLSLLVLLLASVCNSGRMARVLNAGPLRWLGEVSYSVYIFQMIPFMFVVTISGVLVVHGFGGIRFEAIAALFAVGSGALVHRCIDVPVRAALRRLPDRAVALIAACRAVASRPDPLVSHAAPTPEQDV